MAQTFVTSSPSPPLLHLHSSLVQTNSLLSRKAFPSSDTSPAFFKSLKMELSSENNEHFSDKFKFRKAALASSSDTSIVPDDEEEPLKTKIEDKELDLSTRILHFKSGSDPFGAVGSPIYQTATFKQPSATENGKYDYTRSGNPTRDALESLLAEVEGADRAFVFTSGMAALSTATQLVSPGQEIIAGDDLYGGTDRLLSRILLNKGIIIKRVDTSDVNNIKKEITRNTKMIIMESPTNPRIIISDIKAIAELAHENNCLLMIDNSIMTPVLSQPIALGADIVMHSATKFISGHSDVMAGVLAVKGEQLAKDIYFYQNAQGNGLSPFDCWLCLRGIKTLKLRIEKQQDNAQKIAQYLSKHERVKKVNYVGLATHPNRELHYSQCKGPGSVLSFNTGSLEVSKHIVESMKLANITVSFGGTATSISLPCFMSHASIPTAVREARGLTQDLVRLSVGIEDADDLIADLDQALRSAPCV